MINRAIVTGATGYIGSCIVKELIKNGAAVGIICRKSSKMNLLSDVKELVSIYEYAGDIDGLAAYISSFKPEVIFHLASYFIAEHKQGDVKQLVDSNILFGTQLLEAMRLSNVKNIVNASTAWQNYNDEEYNPVSLYAASKEAFENIIRYYVVAEDFEAISMVIFDSYGPGDLRKKLINLLQHISRSGESLEMSGGEQLLDMVYIDDIVSDFLCAANMLIRNEKHLEKYYIRSRHVMSLREVVSTFERVFGVKLNIKWGLRPYRKREVMIPTKRGEEINPSVERISLENGLRRMKQSDI